MIERLTLLTLLVALSMLQLACGDLRQEPQTLAQARALAESRGVPILVDFYADWCGPCQRFSADAEENAVLQQTLQEFVVFKVDVEADGPEGADLAARFQVEGYPTFVVLDAKEETIDRWWGYEEPGEIIGRLRRAVADPTTIAEKKARFDSDPSPSDAALLGGYHISRWEPLQAARYFERAIELGEPTQAYEYDLFQARSIAFSEELTDLAELRAAADSALDSPHLTVEQTVDIVVDLCSALEERDEIATMAPYLERGMAAIEGSDDADLESARRTVSILHALHVLGDEERAVGLKRDGMPEGWQEEGDRLNDFAWWCFENEVNLVEAEQLAHRAVELAETPESRAMYLDTAAELVNLRGDRSEAIALIQRAIAEDPKRDYFREQLARFQGQFAEAL